MTIPYKTILYFFCVIINLAYAIQRNGTKNKEILYRDGKNALNSTDINSIIKHKM